MATINMTVEREVNINGSDVMQEWELEIEFNFSKGCKGARDTICRQGDGPALEPDSDDEIEITSVIDKRTGLEVELTPSELERANDEAWEKVADDKNDFPEPDDYDYGVD